MHDLKELRANPDYFKKKLEGRDKTLPPLIDEVLVLDQKKREYQTKVDEFRKRKNEIATEFSLSKDKPEKIEQLKKESTEIGLKLAQLEKEEIDLNHKLQEKLLWLPNITVDDIPIGYDESQNKEISKWGSLRHESWIKSHWEIGTKLGIFDFERGVKISQSRFTVLAGIGAKLERALINFMLDNAAENGYKEIFPPILVNRDAMIGTGQLPKFDGDFYKCENELLYLIPTAEVPLTSLHKDEVVPFENLPVKYCAYTPCFRREAGAASKDTRGIIRQHQFNKVELVKITSPDTSKNELEGLTSDAEDILKKLELPYRKVLHCSGDLGFAAMDGYDLEVWFPTQNKYREISSCSNFGSFQARRLNIKYKPNAKEKPGFVHTINGSGLAIGRTLAAILENYQTEKGIVMIPKVLQGYLGGLKEF